MEANGKSQAGAAADDVAPAISTDNDAAEQPARVRARAGHMECIEEWEESGSQSRSRSLSLTIRTLACCAASSSRSPAG
jgi:hypothetical protein